MDAEATGAECDFVVKGIRPQKKLNVTIHRSSASIVATPASARLPLTPITNLPAVPAARLAGDGSNGAKRKGEPLAVVERPVKRSTNVIELSDSDSGKLQ